MLDSVTLAKILEVTVRDWAHAVRQVTERHLADRPQLHAETYVKPTILNPHYQHGFLCFSTREEIVTKGNWSIGARDRLFEAEIETLPQTLSLVEAVKSAEVEEPALKVRKASRQLMHLIFEQQGWSKHVSNCVDGFREELVGGPIRWRVKLGISGIHPLATVVTRLFSLSLTVPADVERLYPLALGIMHFNATSFVCPSAAHLIGEFVATEADIHWLIRRVVALLSLFGCGSVEINTYDLTPYSLQVEPSFSDTRKSAVPNKRYVLEAADAERLSQFVDVYLAPMKSVVRREKSPKGRHLQTAFAKYKNSIVDRLDPEETTAEAIAAFEALMLKGSEKTEIVDKLSQRVAILLRHFGNAPLEVRRHMKDAYNVRSEYVHGSTVTLPDNELRSLSWIIVDYARVATLVMLQLSADMKKDDILTLIDDSTIDDELRLQLQEHCSKLKRCWKAS
jgi:hypothetical protein